MKRASISMLAGLVVFVTGITVHSPAVWGGTYSPDDMLVVAGFTVEITGAGSNTDANSAWETASGGSLNVEVAAGSPETDQVQVGQKYVDTLTLRRPLTPRRSGKGSGKFRLKIDGATVVRAKVDSITIEDLVIDERELSAGKGQNFRVYGPGDAHFGSITIRASVMKDGSELSEWWQDVVEGGGDRKQITVIALGRNDKIIRQYDFYRCFPESFQPHTLQDLPRVALEYLRVRCDSLDILAEGAGAAIAEWINATVAGWDWKRNVTIEEITRNGADGRTFYYSDAFPTRYVFPAFSASGTGNLREEIAVKPNRLELD